MKVRKGFVSNSSSSSYIVKINSDYNDFIDKLVEEYGWDFINKKYIRRKIQKEIERLEEILNEIENDNNENKVICDFQKRMNDNVQKTYDKEKNNLKELQKINNKKDLIEFIFEWHYIKVETSDHEVVLNHFTSMHNSFLEGMNDLLKEIVLFFLFDTDYIVKCNREE